MFILLAASWMDQWIINYQKSQREENSHYLTSVYYGKHFPEFLEGETKPGSYVNMFWYINDSYTDQKYNTQHFCFFSHFS